MNTRGRFKAHYGARWRWRRGALFIYWYMYAVEIRGRHKWSPQDYYNSKETLRIKDLKKSQLVTPRQDHRYMEASVIPPSNATTHSVLSPEGGITRQGLDALEDKEFIWPYLDAPCPRHKMFSELMVGKQYERVWKEHFYGHDEPAPRLEVGGHTEPTFALVYARYLKQFGRAGSGTRLGKWLDVWLERADKEEQRLASL